MPANVYLCGPPGAGKSTIAPLLAVLRGAEALDLDALIEREAGSTIASLVDREGEPAFRDREREALGRVAARGNAVVALGGGTISARDARENRAAIARSGILVFLDASLGTCAANVARADGTRPLLREQGALERLHATRRPDYRSAEITVSVDGRAPAEIAREIDARLRETRIVRVPTLKPYDVAIGPSAIDELPAHVAPAPGGRVLVVADQAVALDGERAAAAYRNAGFPVEVALVEGSEDLKSFASLGALYQRFVDAGLDRRGIVAGVGGGTIGDAVGFAAATYQRGVPFVSVPTTLLSAVDAAVGGKTAINLPSGKNLVGSVTQPAHVAIAPQTFRSLPRRDVVSGYGEMIKYGLALDAELYRALREAERALLDDPASALDGIARCVAIKADVVARDEEDRTGIRAILNFGHTVGHALEKVAGYGTLRHGEAVIVGMRAALRLSRDLDPAVRGAADEHLASLPVPSAWRDLPADAVAAATRNDKKQHARGTQFVLLEAIGRARLDDAVEPQELHEALADLGLR